MLQTTTCPLVRQRGRGLRIPSGETPASAEGKRVPSKRNITNNFFMVVNLDKMTNEV